MNKGLFYLNMISWKLLTVFFMSFYFKNRLGSKSWKVWNLSFFVSYSPHSFVLSCLLYFVLSPLHQYRQLINTILTVSLKVCTWNIGPQPRGQTSHARSVRLASVQYFCVQPTETVNIVLDRKLKSSSFIIVVCNNVDFWQDMLILTNVVALYCSL